MSTCTFLGHRQCPPDLRPQLRRVLMDFIEEHGVRTFYVGNQGGFERMACSVLRELCLEYPSVTYGGCSGASPHQWAREERERHG